MINRNKLVELIAACNLQEIFVKHLHWDRAKDPARDIVLQFAEESHTFHVSIVAEKSKFPVCHVRYQGTMPPKSLRRKLEAELLKSHYEHLLVLQDAKGEQVWIYTRKQTDKSDQFIEVSAQQPQLVINKLQGLVFSIDDEDGLNITDVVGRASEQFSQNAERVTGKFYKEFRQHLDAFAEFIKGIEDIVKKEHYASLMLNRLMFIYFIQKKGYLNGEKDYLSDRLKTVQQQHGKDKFYENFYRYFLRTLFHRLSVPPQDAPPEDNDLIGTVPYLNGGLFDEHQIEKEFNIEITDDAFDRIFKFFDKYQWYLDARPNALANEINPDVIGHIFEKYINDRAKMGAYYTKEDITGYIARNTILTALLQKTKKECKIAFHPQRGTIWKLLRKNPDDYIYESVRKGCEKADSEFPEKIRCGLKAKTDVLKNRADWNKKAEEKFALSGETWRECIARRTRYFALKQKIENGDITDIADLTTHNFNIERLTADAIEQHEGTDFISAFYHAIAGRQEVIDKNIENGLTVLDPACGSGAFLFAALNVLQPLYLRCIARMNQFVEEDNILAKSKRQEKHKEYRDILKEIRKHPSEEYWVCRNIILHNLFGVDIMPEAAEVAKLRLFLKLAAESEMDNKKPNMGLEPLPDIDFNIRAGNSLVGFSSMAEFERVASDKLKFSPKLIDKIKEDARIVGLLYRRFIEAQDDGQSNTAKIELSERLEKLNGELNTYLSQIEGVDCGDTRPFHWFAEFYGVIEVENNVIKDGVEKSGGFDVVFGNPPYVEEKKVSYKLPNFVKAKGNLYAFLIEKSVQTLHPDGAFGMIVPISLPSTKRMEGIRDMLRERFPFLYAANFADRPGTLFNGVHQKVTIVMGHSGKKGGFYTTNFLHWSNKNERQELFDGLHYQQNNGISDRWGKFGNEVESRIWQKLQNSERIHCFYQRPSEKRNAFYINMRLMFWVKSCVAPKASREFLPYATFGDMPREAVVAMFNSSIFFWFWEVVGDGWHLTQYELEKFNFGVREKDVQSLADLGTKLEADLEAKKRYVGTRQTEYEYVHANSKKIIDEIDKILAKHYGFTDEELDYIINYDYKYRMSGAE